MADKVWEKTYAPNNLDDDVKQDFYNIFKKDGEVKDDDKKVVVEAWRSFDLNDFANISPCQKHKNFDQQMCTAKWIIQFSRLMTPAMSYTHFSSLLQMLAAWLYSGVFFPRTVAFFEISKTFLKSFLRCSTSFVLNSLYRSWIVLESYLWKLCIVHLPNRPQHECFQEVFHCWESVFCRMFGHSRRCIGRQYGPKKGQTTRRIRGMCFNTTSKELSRKCVFLSFLVHETSLTFYSQFLIT